MLRLLCPAWLVLIWSLGCGMVRAEEPADHTAVRAADQERIAATIVGDTLRLSQLLSNELRYAHSDGRVQTKAQFIAAVAGNKVRYLSFEPQDVALQSITPGAVAMQGRARLKVQANEQRLEFTLRFLAVWRNEEGRWRLLVYQSSQLAETPPAAER